MADEVTAIIKVRCALVNLLHSYMYRKPCLRMCGPSPRIVLPSCGIKAVYSLTFTARLAQLAVSLWQWLDFAPHSLLLVGQICTHVSLCACESS